MANPGLNGTHQDLVDEIMKVLTTVQGLEYCRIEVDLPDSDGNMKTEKLPLAASEGNVSYKTKLNIKTGSGGVSGSRVTGTEAMVAVIVDKTISHIMENFEVAWHDRMEALEVDFNSFLTSMLTAGTTLAASPVMPPGACAAGGAAVIAAVMGVKGPARAAKSSVDLALETAKTMTTNIL